MREITNLQVLQQFIKDRIEENQSLILKRTKFKKYYDGEHEILKKEQPDNKPSNILLFNFAELIIEQNHSYLFSNPITYASKDKDDRAHLFEEKLKDIFFINNETKVTSSLGKTSSIYGEAVEVLWIDEELNIRFDEYNPLEFVFYEFNGEEYALRFYTTKRYEVKGASYEEVLVNKYVIYGKDLIQEFEEIDDKLTLIKETRHFFGEVPVIRYKNKSTFGSEGDSDLKNLITLIDSYNTVASSLVDIIEGNSDPYLLLVNLGIAKEDVEEMKRSRTLKFRSQQGMQAEAKYLTYDGDLSYVENFLDMLMKQIFTLSFTVDVFSKEGRVAAESGEALKMKMAMTSDIKAGNKEVIFKEGLKKRIRLIAKQLQNGSNMNFFGDGTYRKVDSTFTKATIQNNAEAIQMAKDALGIVSRRTILSQIPFIEDVQEEMNEIEREEGTTVLFEDELAGTAVGGE